MACTYTMTYRSQKSAVNSAMGCAGGQRLKVWHCEEHDGWHWARDSTKKRMPCPKCGVHYDKMGVCRCLRDAYQQDDPWRTQLAEVIKKGL